MVLKEWDATANHAVMKQTTDIARHRAETMAQLSELLHVSGRVIALPGTRRQKRQAAFTSAVKPTENRFAKAPIKTAFVSMTRCNCPVKKGLHSIAIPGSSAAARFTHDRTFKPAAIAT